MQTKIPRAGRAAQAQRLNGISRAFTLVEILVVVIILGIAGAIIVPSIGSRDDLKAAAAARVIMADLIYTQNLAITSQGNRYVAFDVAGQKYSVTDSAGGVITHPVNQTPYTQVFGGTSQSNLPDLKLVSTTFIGVSGVAQTKIGFDELGTPLTCNPLGVTETLSTGSILIQAGKYKLKVDIEPFTGQISVNPG
jgi:prepilin-type N-terminal cleavage/methylation domain-containing protein